MLEKYWHNCFICSKASAVAVASFLLCITEWIRQGIRKFAKINNMFIFSRLDRMSLTATPSTRWKCAGLN